MTMYRPHRGLLCDSMKEATTLTGRGDLITIINNSLGQWGMSVTDNDVHVEPYCQDDRIGWSTYIVTIRNVASADGHRYFGAHMEPEYFGAFGFTDGPL